ncbi:NUDIX domain-containing protein [Streptomyces sp. NPDC089919]|uniref:NUDIX domain-containing protein n=1 Tax=Streptomyces sp. NPDC089919 TaxID=3155188 RepID=UPI003445ECDA
MTQKRSAGLLLFRRAGAAAAGPVAEVLIGHMGGPFYEHRDAGAWSIPKGEYEPEEAPMAAARREFEEELGLAPPEGPYLPLGEVRQRNGKLVTVWAVEAELDPAAVVPGTFRMEWPPRSGNVQEFPEIDRVRWCPPELARQLLVPAQADFLDRLAELLGHQE